MVLASPRVRPPAVAGRFYPGDRASLREAVEKLVAGVSPHAGAAPKAVIAPHAGYIYSGAVAAAAFAALRPANRAVDRIVLIGPAHYEAFRGVAVASADAFATPLGEVPCDRQARLELQSLPAVVTNDAAHAPEHALEVELPFLQVLFGFFAIVPLLVGEASPDEVAAVLRKLWGGPETLIVVSSDLSHFHACEAARQLDAGTAAAIEAGHWTALDPGRACGALAISGLLIEAARRGLRARRLALCNSGDTAGDRERVVGYGAWAFQPPADRR